MENYKLKLKDFKRAIEFGVNFYIEPSKNTSGRTTGEPRGLGSILDSFTLGKLTEIGVESILNKLNSKKSYILDFDIKSNDKVKDEPDIVKIGEGKNIRDPKIFVEIKNTSEKGRWIGLTEEQFNTMKRSAGNRSVYIVFASINSNTIKNNPKTTDLTGMFLKEIEDENKSQIFQDFANLNAECKIEFIISSKELEKLSFPFEKGMNMYETNVFSEKERKAFYTKDLPRKDIKSVKCYKNFNEIIKFEIQENQYPEKKEISEFKVKGSFNLIRKNKKLFIECLSDVSVSNDIFGEFRLNKGSFYNFHLSTLGRDPQLKRNNLFISKNRVYQLIASKKIANPDEVILNIAKNI